MTDLEEASKDLARMKELWDEIEQCKVYQLSCKKNNDNIGDKTWANHIKTLKAEISILDRKGKYIRFSIFTQCVKAYLTPKQYADCWERVTEILEKPELMQ